MTPAVSDFDVIPHAYNVNLQSKQRFKFHISATKNLPKNVLIKEL